MWEALYKRIMDNCFHDPETGCKLWLGNTDGKEDPYGRMTFKGQTIAVHIAAFKSHFRLRKGYHVDHRCNRRLCCEITHLQQVTNLKNQRLKKRRAKHRDDVFKCLAVK